MTRHPSARATAMAARPMPPPAPSTRTDLLAWLHLRPRWRKAYRQVQKLWVNVAARGRVELTSGMRR